MSDLTVAGLEDKEDRVYVFGVSQYASESMKEWFLSDDTIDEINKQFDNARVMTLPLKIDGEMAVEEVPVQQVELVVTDEPQNETEDS